MKLLKKNLSTLLVIAPAIVLLLLVFATNLKEIPVETKEPLLNFTGNESLLLSPLEPGDGFAAQAQGAPIDITFSIPTTINGFSFLFGGNLHEVSSYLAEDFDIYVLSANGEWHSEAEIRSNKKASFVYMFEDSREVLGIRLVIHKAPFSNAVLIKDLKFYNLKTVTVLNGLTHFLQSQSKSVFSYYFYSIIFYFWLIIPGFVVMKYMNTRLSLKFSGEKLYVFAPVISFCLLAAVTTFYLLFRQKIIFDLYWLYFLFSIYLLIKNTYWKEINISKQIIFVTAFALLITTSLQIKRDYLFNLNYIEHQMDALQYMPHYFYGGYFGYHADNTMPWGIARAYINDAPLYSEEASRYRIGFGPESVIDRTPMLPLMVAPILRTFGESHFIYQRFLTVIMLFYYPAAFILLKRYFNEKTATIVSILMLLSVQLTFQVNNVEIYYKFIAIFPTFLALVSLKSSKTSLFTKHALAGLLLGVSYLIHPITLFFVITLGVLHLKGIKLNTNYIKRSLYLFGPVLVLFAVWMLFTLYIRSIAPEHASLRQAIYVEEVSRISTEPLLNKLYNVVNIFVPDFQRRANSYKLFSSDYFRIEFSRLSLIAAVTPFFLLTLVLKGFRKKFFRKYFAHFVFGLFPFVVYLAFFHKYSLGGYILLYPFTLPFLFGLIVTLLQRIELEKRIYIYLSYPVFMLVPFYYISEVFTKLLHKNFTVYTMSFILFSLYIYLSFLLIAKVTRYKGNQ
ncbi:MAG: hypothetical protein ACOZAO_03150 [Patescibacteria group bacterium]